MVKEPVLAPVTVGLKVIRIMQEAPTATLAPQLLVWEKSPLVLILVMLRVAFPEFLSVTLLALLEASGCEAKVKEVGESVTTGPMPDPVRMTVWVAGEALSVMVKVPVLVPAVEGRKVTRMLQLTPAATLLPQVLV